MNNGRQDQIQSEEDEHNSISSQQSEHYVANIDMQIGQLTSPNNSEIMKNIRRARHTESVGDQLGDANHNVDGRNGGDGSVTPRMPDSDEETVGKKEEISTPMESTDSSTSAHTLPVLTTPDLPAAKTDAGVPNNSAR